jgi:hypothetical protein
MNTFKLCIALLCLASAALSADQIYTKNKKANQLYKKGEYGEALKMYDDLSIEAPAEPKIKMNKGSAHYQMGDLDKAEEAYNGAAQGLKDKKALADLYYNLGNTKYMQGDQLAAQGKQEAMDKYKGALENYIKSLDLKPHDKDAKWNLQLTAAKIKEMQNQQQNKNDKNKNDKNRDDKQKQQQNDQNKDQNKNDKNKDQNKDQQNKDDKKQDKKDQDKQNQNSQQDQKQQDKQKPEPTPAQQKKEDMKKDEAKKLLEIYADDEHDLNKKPEKTGLAGQKKNEKDW